MAHDISIPDPTNVLTLLEAFRWSKTMFAAVSLGVFDALEHGPQTTAALAARLDLNADALERLLNACVNLQLLRHTPDGFANTPAAQTYLTRSSPRRMTGYIDYSNTASWKLWGCLEGAIRDGSHRWTEAFGWDGPIFSHFFKTDDSKREFLMGMHGFGQISSPVVVSAFDLTPFRTFVDLGGATGHLAIAACQRWPQLSGVVFDLPSAVSLATEMVTASPVAARITITAGNFFEDALPKGDLYAVGRILHDWTEEKILLLLQRIHAALPAGGAVLVCEKLLDDDKAGPRWAEMQNLNMLTCTEGKERTLAEYEALLTKAGFTNVQGCRTASPLDAVLAFKV